jgi:phosphate transport system permease protein
MPGFLTGFSWLAGSLVLSIMILPTITSVSYDAFRAVPQELRTGSLALGRRAGRRSATSSHPFRLTGVLTAVVLGMTRAAGEALAVQMVIGNSPTLPAAITQPVTTLTSQITLDMGNTVFGEPWQDALWTMSLVLLIISITSVVLVRVINKRRMGVMTATAGPPGRAGGPKPSLKRRKFRRQHPRRPRRHRRPVGHGRASSC